MRCYYFELRDTRRTVRGRRSNSNVRGNFIGSIWGLDEEQDLLPRLHVQYMFMPYFGAGITYDHVGAKTVDWGNEEATRTSSDGTVEIWGPMLYLTGRYPNSTLCTPFAELGWVSYRASFDTSSAWAATAPGYRFEVDDTSGTFFGVGVDVEVHDRWSVSLYYRRMNDAEVDARAYFTPGPRVGRYGAFPMEYTMFGLGATYRF
ncbi:MAG: outer membrane beta-barrel protein [Kiritimatiellae bacterium]|nr:outer membrane beta-barrel protein [Kiritimatiellia bacterium]